jgi:prevent-host-death family protein
MAEIGLKEFKASASRVIAEVEAGASYVVTKRGRLAAAIVPIEYAENLVLAHAEEFIRMRRRGRRAYVETEGSRLEEIS